VPVLSLPGLSGTRLETIPGHVPYLVPDAAAVAAWRDKLQPYPGYKVGIVWQGNPHHKWDRWRSVRLADLEPLARVPGVRLISVQRQQGSEQLVGPGPGFPVTALEWPSDDFVETAALMANLDLVVTVDTAAAHLAGALGVPVWVLVYATADWRWLFGRDDSPWYPTMRLFRQRRLGRWGATIRRVARRLGEQPQKGAKGAKTHADLFAPFAPLCGNATRESARASNDPSAQP
jgi:hypothetical protein